MTYLTPSCLPIKVAWPFKSLGMGMEVGEGLEEGHPEKELPKA